MKLQACGETLLVCLEEYLCETSLRGVCGDIARMTACHGLDHNWRVSGHLNMHPTAVNGVRRAGGAPPSSKGGGGVVSLCTSNPH